MSPLMSSRIAFLGGGNMADALLGGLLRSGVTEASSVIVAEPLPVRREYLVEKHGVNTTGDNRAAVKDAEIVVLAVKPQVMDGALDSIRDAMPTDALTVSIAAGVSCERIEARLGGAPRVVRTMPNTPALVSAGATGIARGAHATEDDVSVALRLFESVGNAVEVPEGLLDAVTGLSGSGPAYVFVFIEALADAGVKNGLPRGAALALAAQTVKGAAELVLSTGKHPGELKDMVTSPGGTTIAGVSALERGAFRGTVIDAVTAATERSKELG
jgi:pyrroline-5-carboxylate reductase